MRTKSRKGAGRRRAAYSLGGLLVTLSCFGCSGHIPDAALAETFKANAASFEQLRRMFMVDDNLITISGTHVVGRNETVLIRDGLTGLLRVGLKPARYAEYLKLFDALGLKGGVTRDATKLDNIIFRAEKPSLFNGGSEKGYSYSAKELSPCFDNLDRYVPSQSALNRPEGHIVYGRLGPHWYLYKGW